MIALASGFSCSSVATTLYGEGVRRVNPLLGHWRLSKVEVNGATPGAGGGCEAQLTFEEERVLHITQDGQQWTETVANYNVQPNLVFIVGIRGDMSTGTC